MSLLIKALEQTAKDRAGVRVAGERAPAFGKSADVPHEPTLEPMPAPRLVSSFDEPAPRRSPVDATQPVAPVAPAAPLSLEMPALQRRPVPSTSSTPDVENDQPLRADSASRARDGQAHVPARPRGNPILMLGGVAVLVGIGFGIHVYLQIAKPDVFPGPGTPHAQRMAAPAYQPVPPVADPRTPEARTTAETPAPGTTPAPAPEHIAATTLADTPPPAEALPRPTTSSAPADQGDARSSAETRSTRKPIPASTVLTTDRQTEAPAKLAPEPRPERTVFSKDAAPRPAPTASQPGARSEPRGEGAASPANDRARVNPHVSEGYALLQAGELGAARSMYTRAIDIEPLNIDALLGLAYIASQEHRSDDAVKTYLRILQLNPRHAVAQAALIALMGRADPSASETRLKQLVAREPSAFLHFVLGNLYSDQALWNQAQRAYFQAHHLEPDNPDYAYNLAVGLDQLKLRKPALEFYRRADELARSKGRSNFDVANARRRIESLASQLE